jgi:NAD(P)-dependent dehydrogenase (short-subunit alcohol dehydrogenase family)
MRANVASAPDVARLFSETKAAFGRLDILVNNAGIYTSSRRWRTSRKRSFTSSLLIAGGLR